MMERSALDVARDAMEVCRNLEGFQATETISAGAIHAEGRIRYRRTGMVTVEYRKYEDPLSDFEERYAGASEFVPQELLELQITCDGRQTWLYNPKRNVAICRDGRRLYSPLRMPDGIAALDFMRSLTHDFLLREEGTEEVHGRKARRIGLKPKEEERSTLLKEERFPITRAIVSIDEQTSFPLRIVLYPSRRSLLFYIAGPSTPVTIEYRDILLTVPKEDVFSFTPPPETRVFREEIVKAADLDSQLPFSIPVSALEERGYKLYSGKGTITVNEAADRAYATLVFARKEEQETADGLSQSLSLRAGNYLSPNMNRRRAFLAENGEEVIIGETKARVVDRDKLVADEIPESARRSIIEIGWESNGVNWFLLAEDTNRENLLEVVRTIVGAGRKEETS